MRIAIQTTWLIASLIFVEQIRGQSPERSAWLAERREMIVRARAVSDEQTILDLSRIVRGIGSDLPNASEEAKRLYKEAFDLLKGIPGHAEYYRDKILSAQERLQRHEGESPASQYLEEQMYGFQTLAHLHSPEGVRVIGEMLSNNWESPGNKTAGPAERIPVLSEQATGILTKFPIKDKPFTDRLTMKTLGEAREAWRLWYEQIKSGNRTFRFEGDTTEYDLDGPASKVKVQHIERDRKRDAERTTGTRKSHDLHELPKKATSSSGGVLSRPGIVAALVASGLLLIAALGIYMKKRR